MNLEKHIENLQKFGSGCGHLKLLCDRYGSRYAFIRDFCEERGCEFALSEVWAKGGEGGEALAQKVLDTLANKESHYHALYPDEMSLKDKVKTIATEIYGADGVSYAPAASKALARIEEMGFGNLPVCMAKTQYSCLMTRLSWDVRPDLPSMCVMLMYPLEPASW